MELLSCHLNNIYINIFLEIICSGIKIRYIRSSKKIIRPNLPIANNTPNILTQDLDKQIAHNRGIKLNTILDMFILNLFRLKPKPNGDSQQIHYLLYS